MKRVLTAAALLAIFAANGDAWASEGHFDVFIGDASGATAYGGIEVGDGDVTLNQRVFESELGENILDNIYFADEPGFNHPEDDSVLPAGVTSLGDVVEIFVRPLSLSIDGGTGDLFVWDGVGAPLFAPAVGVDFDIATPGTDQSIGFTGAGGGFDDHPLFELSAGGVFPTPGIYLGSFEVEVDGLTPSDPLFLVMGTEGLVPTDEELEGLIELAVEHVEASLVPEPTSAILVMVSGLGLACRRAGRRS